ncbi:MAG: hypothetical protein QNJ90_08865 [Planctomycetota bacterium]|nr:hypothetical protein [Planctomycetota bacterium]
MPSQPNAASRAEEGGFALLVAVISVLLIAAMIVSGTQSGLARDGAAQSGAHAPVRAREVALAGVAEALSWFRRQNVQPVTTFAPRLEPTANPPVNETMDPAVGLVREYEVTPGIWARYEVRLASAEEPFVDTNGNGFRDGAESFTDQNGNGAWDAAAGVRDVSGERGQVAGGAVWLVEAHGELYRRPRGDLPLGDDVNWRIAYDVVATELRRMAVKPPAGAAICARRGSQVTIGNRARIRGGSSVGVAVKPNSGNPVLQSGSEVSGSPATTSVPGWKSGLKGVFGLTLSDLKGMADAAVTDASILPPSLGEYTLTVIEGDALFNAERPLRGTGIVVVQGDCTLAAGSNSFFNGLLWCSGRLVIHGPCYLRGTFIGQDDVDVQGAGGDFAEIEYDAGIVADLLTRMGTYRRSKGIFPVASRPGVVVTGGTD